MSFTNENVVNKPSTYKGVNGKYFIEDSHNSLVVDQKTGNIFRCKRVSDLKKFWLKKYDGKEEFSYAERIIPDSPTIGVMHSVDIANSKSKSQNVFFIVFDVMDSPLTSVIIQEKDLTVVIADALRGLKYLHDTLNVAHGNLNTNSILVGDRFAVSNVGRLSDFVDSPSVVKMKDMGIVEEDALSLAVEGSLPLADRKKHDIYQLGKMLNNFYLDRYRSTGKTVGAFVQVRVPPYVEGNARATNHLGLIAEMVQPHEDRRELDYFIEQFLKINRNSP